MHTYPVGGAWQDDLLDRAGLEAADKVLQHAACSLLKHLWPGGWSLAEDENQHILLIHRGHERNFRQGSWTAHLHFHHCKALTGRLSKRAGAFLWDIMQQPWWIKWIKSHCFPLAARGAAPCCSNLTLPLHTVHFSGGLSNWFIPLCEPLINVWKRTHPQMAEEQGGSRKPEQLCSFLYPVLSKKMLQLYLKQLSIFALLLPPSLKSWCVRYSALNSAGRGSFYYNTQEASKAIPVAEYLEAPRCPLVEDCGLVCVTTLRRLLPDSNNVPLDGKCILHLKRGTEHRWHGHVLDEDGDEKLGHSPHPWVH